MLLLDVNRQVFGWVCLQLSWMLNSDLKSRSASMACMLSCRVGALSSGSSVMLKSPAMKSIWPRLLSRHAVLISSQKVGCSWGLLGAYICSIFILCSLCHFSERDMALPGIRIVNFVSSMFNFSLLRMNATPMELPGLVGSLELSTWRRLEKRLSICVLLSGARWVSCMHNMLIFSSRISLLMDGHLDV